MHIETLGLQTILQEKYILHSVAPMNVDKDIVNFLKYSK